MLVYLNGEFVSRDDAKVSVFDHGYLYGDGIYETLRSYKGVLFCLDRHLARLKHSADSIALKLPFSIERIVDALLRTVKVNRLSDAYVRVQISRGPGEIGLDPALCPEPTTVIVAKPFKEYPKEYFEQGVPLAIVNTRRNHPLALNPSIKGTNFLNNILAKIESIRAGAFEAVMLNWEGYVAEGTVSNVFFVKSGLLRTPNPETGILEGVTRGLVLELAGSERIDSQESLISPEEMLEADECFITNTTVEIMPVTSINGQPVGNGKPGPVTAALSHAYKNEVQRCLKMQSG